jgi:hypothetical protein
MQPKIKICFPCRAHSVRYVAAIQKVLPRASDISEVCVRELDGDKFGIEVKIESTARGSWSKKFFGAQAQPEYCSRILENAIEYWIQLVPVPSAPPLSSL